MSKSKVRFSRLAVMVSMPALLVLVALALPSLAVAAPTGSEAARCDTFAVPGGATYFAVSLPPTPTARASTHQLVILVDTSAGQAGAYRDKALEIVGSLLQTAGQQDHVQLMAVDLNAIPLTKGFVAPRGAEIDAAMAQLRHRVPLGATDMAVALDKAIETFATPSAAARTVVYIGDGSSKANAMIDEYSGLVDRLVKNHISVTSYAIGQQLDASLLAALANQTGGMLVTDSERFMGKEAGQQLLRLAEGAVVWPTSTTLPKAITEAYPKRTPPLRSDRDTILVGKLSNLEPFAIQLTAEAAGKPITLDWNVQPRKSDAENAYLAQLVDAARADDGYRLPTVGSEGLWESRRLVNLGAQALARLGSQAAATGNKQQAHQLVDEALRRDPNNARAILLKDQLRAQPYRDVVQAEPIPPPAGAEPPAAAPAADAGGNDLRLIGTPPPRPAADVNGEGTLLQNFDTQTNVLIGKIVAEVNHQLDVSRGTIADDPARVKQDLTLLLERVVAAPELPADTRVKLREQIEHVIKLTDTRLRTKEYEVAEQQRTEAAAKENIRIQDGLIRSEQRIKQLVERMNALMQEGRYAEAEEQAANEALKAAPESPTAHAASLESRIINNYAMNSVVRDQGQKQYLASMHLVDVSSIPFPDEPPIVYPPAEQWRELTKAREKYRSVDLKEPGSAEAKILKALDEPTTMEFVDTPLKDVVDQLKLQHGIEIQLDMKALTEANVSPDTPITKSLKGISLRSALRLMLGEKDLNYIIDHEVLLITTADKAKATVVTKVYPVADLVLPIAVNSGLNPFQSGAGLGGNSSINSGTNGTMGGGGFGGGGFGGGGGGGGFGGGGGAFDVADPGAAPQPAAVQQPAAIQAAVAAPQGKAVKLEIPKDSKDLDAAWNDYFAKLAVADKLPLVRQQNASIRETVRQLMNAQKFGEVTAVIRGALRNGWGQPWMYEALSLAMQADNQPRAEIERALMSAVAFAHTNNDLLYIAAYLSRAGFDARALKLYRQAAQMDPSRYEPYMQGLQVALRLRDTAGIEWACVGVLSQTWPSDKAVVAELARRAATSTLEQLRAAHQTQEAERFQTALNNALVRDCIVRVRWDGDAEVDVAVQEPSGTVCSLRDPRTTSGGTLLTGSAARASANEEGIAEQYVVSEGFAGTYRMLLRRVWGKPTAGKVTVDIYSHWGTKKATHQRRQIPVGEQDALVTFELKDGRRQEPLAQAQVANAAQNMMGVNQAILAQMVAAPAAAANPAAVANANANKVAQLLAQINDPNVAQAFAVSRSPNTVPGPGGGGDIVVGDGLNPFVLQGAVGYQPVITTLPEGTNMSATAVISADRRYVRISVVPLFSSIGNITTFNFATGEQSVQSGSGGQLGQGAL